jgi:hypothetical protein
MKLNMKIALGVGGLVVALVVLGALLTDGLACNPKRERPYLGFTCGEWIQSLSQAFGGLMTMLAVMVTIWWTWTKEGRERRERLQAMGHELQSAIRHARFSAWQLGLLGKGLVVMNPESVRGIAAHELSIQPRLSLGIFRANGADLSILRSEAAAKVIDAYNTIEQWNRILDASEAALLAVATVVDPQRTLEQRIKGAQVVEQECLAAIAAIETATGMEIPKLSPYEHSGTG